eukprot:Phypoly_transcript_10568.p1 GENE.Phypoly_transcript_10568~~Phypoly_transcript_10568.p1  ORF type:complete len:302 (+),score=16.25 Phypoly_transcript_10568:359-1264(+)
MNSVVAFLLFVCVIGEAYGHAVLESPSPWWWEPSRTRPCGGANVSHYVHAVWPAGSNQSVLWWAVNGDGLGQVHARIDQYGKVDNFSNGWQIGFKQPNFLVPGQYNVSFIVPNIQCFGPNNSCTMQFWTDSGGGWYSCTSIQITCSNCSGGVPISHDECVKASNLKFCPGKDGSQILAPTGTTPAQIDALTQNTFTQNYQSGDVFQNGNSTACQNLYHQLLCELYFTPCGGSTSNYTMQQCQQTMQTCNVTEDHKNLYNCSLFPSAASSGGSGGSGHSSGSASLYVAWVCILAFGIVSILL